jgi:type I restriction enzyme M protein
MSSFNLQLNKELKEFNSLFLKLGQRLDYITVFDDLLTLKICCFGFGTNEELYLNTIKKYEKNEINILCKLMAELLLIYSKAKTENRWIDPLGDFYEFLSSSSKKSALGQFFTPPSVCDLITMMISDDNWDQIINEPCSGSGRMVLSMNQKTKGSYYVCQELDPICAKMTAINCLMHEIKCEVHCMDSLKLDRIYTSYYVNHHFWKLKTPHIIQK